MAMMHQPGVRICRNVPPPLASRPSRLLVPCPPTGQLDGERLRRLGQSRPTAEATDAIHFAVRKEATQAPAQRASVRPDVAPDHGPAAAPYWQSCGKRTAPPFLEPGSAEVRVYFGVPSLHRS